MIKIVALNDGEEEINEDEENVVSREAQETIAESEYIRAIKLKSDGEVDLCFHLLKELLETQVLNENINNKPNQKLWIIKYNCHKNIALILEERSEYILALQHYISAILIDSSDVSTLYRFGQLALKLQATDLAEYAFESCLRRNSAHWCAAEGMLQVMNTNHNIIGSYSFATKLCQQNVNSENAETTLKEITKLFKQNLKFLKNCSGFEEIPLTNECNSEHFKLLLPEESLINKNEDSCSSKAPDLTKFNVENYDWRSVGQFIVDVYSYLKEIQHDMIFMFNFNDFIGKKKEEFLPDMIIVSTETEASNMDKMQTDASISDCVKNNDDVIDPSKVSTAEKSDVQPMDLNNSDSDSNLKSDGCEANKTKPRRRCSDLHFLEQWGWHKNRRYSSRKKNERDDIDTSLNGYLSKILTKYTNISLEDKWPFSAVTGNNIAANMECNECKADMSEEQFNLKTQNEFELFKNKLKEKSVDVMQLSYKWLKYISFASDLRIPESLKRLYIEIFKIYNCHFSESTWNQLNATNYEASYRMSLLYLELSARDYITDNSQCDIWRNVFNHLLFNIGHFHIISACSFETYQLKLIYLEYLLLNKAHQYKDCLSCLKQMFEILEKQDNSFVLHLPNLDNMCINIENIQNLQLKFKRQIDINNIPKFYEDGLWDKLTEIIISHIETTENQFDNVCWLKDFCAQIEILLQSFWITASYENCLIWSEKCFHFAVTHYLQEPKNSSRSSLLAEIINFVTSYIEAIILNEGFHFVVTLKNENLCRLVQNIIRILVYQFDGTFEKNSSHGRELNFKRTWVILHQLILREENDSLSAFHTKTDETQDVNEMIPKSFLILFTAHEYLGKRQWCTNDNGEFLQYVLDAVVLNLKAPVYDVCRDIIYEYIEQVTYCLFKYPQKKARLRHLEDHEANQIELNWPNAIQVFDLYRPEDLPEFNSYKLESITSDMEQLLLKVLSLMPKELDPSKSIHHVTMFIEGRLESPPRDSNAFKLPYKVLSLYYLLADFYFKNRDFAKAIKFYTLDLTINPTRFDSWAGMALSKASKIETKLNGLDPLSMDNIWEECEAVLRCFECCINLNRFQTLLWIEYGSFSYTIHSCFSRHLKSNSNDISEETLSKVNERKNKMLTIAYNCFSLATSLQNSPGKSEDDSDSNDEKWLCQYMLGKISEKRKEEPKVYLNHYLMAANYLYESSATYPIKINHSNPTTLSVEALEVFYRINAAIIKYLKSENEISRSTGELFNKVLKNLSSSPFAYNKAKIDGNSLNMLKGKTSNKFKPPTNCVAKREESSLAVDNKTPANESLKNVDNAELEEAKDNEKNSKPAIKDCFPPTTSTLAASSTSTSVISSDTSTIGSESESDDSVTDNENNLNSKRGGAFTAEELKTVYRMVVQNIEECVTRFPEHYKSIYRLIYHYMNSPAEYYNKDLSEQLLLGQYKTSLGNLVSGLFYDRKNNNLFNGIWRIPSSEIDRPGSFSAHLVKCVKIFIQLLFSTKNHGILVDLAINLYKTPDVDKRYITDAERKELCQESLNCSIKVLRSVLEKNIEKRNDTETLNLLIDIYKIHKKCIKYMNHKEPMFAEILIDVYKFFIKDKVEYIPDNCNFLDLAIKLCVQEITSQKNMEKSLQGDSNTVGLDNISLQSSENQNFMASRVIHIPGLNTRQKNRGGNLKPSTSTALNMSTLNTLNMSQIEFVKHTQFLTALGSGVQLSEKDNPGFHKLFEEIYSKMLHNELRTCSTASMFPQNPMNYMANPAPLNISNSMGLMLPYSAATPPTSEASTFKHSLSIDENNTLLKQLSKPKSSEKNKTNFKPYNRPAFCASAQNASNDTVSSYKTDILSNSVNALSTYSNLFNTALSQIDLSNKKLKEQISETAANYSDKKDFQNNTTSYKAMSTQIASARLPSTSQLRTQFSNQQPTTSSQNINSPTKTLQEKLAERQKAYQLNETNTASDLASSRDKLCDDVIVLD